MMLKTKIDQAVSMPDANNDSALDRSMSTALSECVVADSDWNSKGWNQWFNVSNRHSTFETGVHSTDGVSDRYSCSAGGEHWNPKGWHRRMVAILSPLMYLEAQYLYARDMKEHQKES
ncbi:unnamed protein product [Soboliphyme baturini]|uniref:Ig-like domain-containing protein n=1 Tax=Soboliphyme baturini TaxID=241478 RepID=A0A183IS90_9BILA|nr:unnamed protein product [Soboliphyme baturini]